VKVRSSRSDRGRLAVIPTSAAELGTWAELKQEGDVIGLEPAPTDPVWHINLGYDQGPLSAAGETLTSLGLPTPGVGAPGRPTLEDLVRVNHRQRGH
jgi:hypothetical protein